MFTVGFDERSLKEVQSRLGSFKSKAPNAIASALNRGMSNINTNIKKEVRKEYHIKAGDIDVTLKKNRASKGSLSAEVKSKGGAIPLDKFKVTPKSINPKRKSTLSVAVKKDGVKKLKGAFMADINGPKLFLRAKKSRLPIGRLFGPSIPQMLGNEDIGSPIQEKGQDAFEKRLDHEINRILTVRRSS
ncbi:phage tail protein [Psychrobacillus sp.]|uniref:phage tail protein n=1 Tax=Psychrobacillus sp. TaxID=1871623 RepID=UPI0028BF2238|nr:phage tail protein [Psychrobacillus sp.]